MIALITEKAEDCHEMRRFFNSTEHHERWSITIDCMIRYDADFKAGEKEEIFNWLICIDY